MAKIEPLVCILIILGFSLSSVGKEKKTDPKIPVDAVNVALKFADAINQSRFAEAYELTDRKAKIAPAWFSSLSSFTDRAKRERPFSETHPGQSKFQEFNYINPSTLRVELYFQFEVRLCRQSSKKWKVCYFQTHAG